MIYLLDGSQSMLLGKSTTRWDDALAFIKSAHLQADSSQTGHIQGFRFGHRLEPLASNESLENIFRSPTHDKATLQSVNHSSPSNSAIAPPNATDSRLADAMRQLLSQVSPRDTAGVVLLSDGRVRNSEAVEKLAELYKRAKVPLHVALMGEMSGNGDVSLLSVVAPSKTRKHTENEVQVFFRSYGYSGQRTTVRIQSRRKMASDELATIASVPITLTGGPQSASLLFRIADEPEEFLVSIDPVPGELTERNNQVALKVDIDRTKVRVLYLDNASLPTNPNIVEQLFSITGLTTNNASSGASVEEALEADIDVECLTLASDGVSQPLSTANNNSTSFPKTRSELFAYDCVILSNLGPEVLNEEQNEWLAQWIVGRGGGFIVINSRGMNQREWNDSPLSELLPVQILPEASPSAAIENMQVVSPNHPIWKLRLDDSSNGEILKDLPPLSISRQALRVKPTAEVLLATSNNNTPVMLAHRAGRGRVIVSTANIAGNAYGALAKRWGPQPERVAAKFWRNLVYWATEGSSTGRRRLVAESDKTFYRPGESLAVSATLYDEAARRTNKYKVWAMLEPTSLEDTSLYSPLLWPENLPRPSGDASPRIAWGEEIELKSESIDEGYKLQLLLSDSSNINDSGLRIELTAYEGSGTSSIDHGTQVDSSSLAIKVLNDPFEQQNPLPNHELMERLASLSGGKVLSSPDQLTRLLQGRIKTQGPPKRELTIAWSRWWLWLVILGLISTEWIIRRMKGFA